MFKQDLALRLDEDFLYIMHFLKHCLDAFQNEDQGEERHLSNLWLDKLCGEQHTTITAKRLRNNYLTRLVTCFQHGRLMDPFLRPPPVDHLEPVPLLEKPEANPTWLEDLIAEAKELMPSGGQTKDCQTYISSKIFEENRGACVYVAVAVADEGEIPQWIKIGEDLDDYDTHLEKIFSRMTMTEKEPDKMKPAHSPKGLSLHEQIVEAIDREMANITEPNTFQALEETMKLYMQYITGSDIAKKSLEFTGAKARKFFLTHLRSELQCDLNDH